MEVGERGTAYGTKLQWLLAEVKQKGTNCPKTLIYCPSINKVAKLHEWFMGSLSGHAWDDRFGERVFSSRLVCQFHKSVGPELESLIMDTFHKEDSTLRILISTVAFGMGINIPDIHYVIHWGLSQSVSHYWQEVGRCARKIPSGKAILFPVRIEADNEVGKIVASYHDNRKCFRRLILSEFIMPGIDTSCIESTEMSVCTLKCRICDCKLCNCCTYCKAKCPCMKCDFVSDTEQ